MNGSKNGHSMITARCRFDEFEVDPQNRICTRGGISVPMTGKVFDVLLAFVENPGRLMSKAELMEKVWPDEFVEEGNLARNVSTLRKLLGDTSKEPKVIATVPGHGYRFVADVSTVVVESATGQAVQIAPSQQSAEIEAFSSAPIEEPRSRKLFWILASLIIVFTAAWFSKDRLFVPSPNIRSLAVLPLKGIDPNDNYLGIGIADAIIRRVGSSEQVAVRPTSAVLRYVNQDTDSLAIARELNADAILEGNVQRSGDKLRVSVNLLRTSDGISIWSESFNMPANDIFRVQDEVAQQVAQKLKIRLGSSILASDKNKYPVDQRAYEFYLKGMYSLDARGFDKESMPQLLNTIDLFEQATIIDPNYAMAHGQLAFCYVWMAIFIQTDEPKWADRAREEIALAEKLDPNVAEAHVANGLLYWSFYGGYKSEEAVRELRLAKQLNPGYNGADLIALYGHIGLDEQGTKELNRGLTSDPTSQALNGLTAVLTYLSGDLDAWYELNPKRNIEERALSPWYLLHKGPLDLAEKVLEDRIKQNPEDLYDLLMDKALLFALKGNYSQADAQIKMAFPMVPHTNENYHHETYSLACVQAMEGNSAEAVKWLRETANTGYPNYRLFAQDSFLDRIRQSPEFIQFLAEQKAQWERFEQEFPVE